MRSGAAGWGMVLALGAACVSPPPGAPDAAPPEVDPTSLPPSVLTAGLADAVVGLPYGDRLLAKDGVPPYQWAASGPAWLVVEAGTGALSGTPTGGAGTQLSVTVTVRDTAGHGSTKALLGRVLGCTPGATLVCQQPSSSACRVGQQQCQPDGTWSTCLTSAASTSASGCGAACAACGPDADRCGSGGTQCTCGPSSGPCAAGSSCCPGADGGARCANLAADPSACGSCGTRCAAPPNADATCDAGVCGASCRSGFAACDGQTLDGCEVDLRTDPDHCGACSTACAGTSTGSRACDGGACDLLCNASFPLYCGFRDCRPYDLADCGGCNVACPDPGQNAGAPTGCAGPGTCSYACATNYGDCNGGLDGCETDLTSTPTHCGACSNDCVAQGWDGGCVGGQCARCYVCGPGPNPAGTACCGEKCHYNSVDTIWECLPCAAGSLIDGGC